MRFYDVNMGQYGLLLLFIAIAFLGGCASDRLNRAAATAVDAQSLPPGALHCLAVARERADDALANGYAFDIEESVYRETYGDCVAWRARDTRT